MVGRNAVLRGPLEDEELLRLLAHLDHDLRSTGARADDAHALAADVHLLLRPASRVVDLALERTLAREVRVVGGREQADALDEELGRVLLARAGRDLPASGLLVEDRLLDAGVELDAPTQVPAISAEVQVGQDLLLPGVALAPLPLLEELLVMEVAVGVDLGVRAGSGVRVPEPRAAHAGTLLEGLDGESEHVTHLVKGVDATEARSNNSNIYIHDIGHRFRSSPVDHPLCAALRRTLILSGAPRGEVSQLWTSVARWRVTA